MNWIVPGRLLAFPGPDENEESETLGLAEYIYLFKNDMNIKSVIRLNHELYQSDIFTSNQIVHRDL